MKSSHQPSSSDAADFLHQEDVQESVEEREKEEGSISSKMRRKGKKKRKKKESEERKSEMVKRYAQLHVCGCRKQKSVPNWIPSTPDEALLASCS